MVLGIATQIDKTESGQISKQDYPHFVAGKTKRKSLSKLLHATEVYAVSKPGL